MCGFQYVADRPGVGGRGVVGITINIGLPDSTYGPSPDVIARSGSVPSSQTFNLYRYRLFPDSINAVGRVSPTYNVAVMAMDVESIRPTPDNPNPFAVKRIIGGLLKFVDEIPTNTDPEVVAGMPESYSLSQNYPNPFNPATKINFAIPVAGQVTLKVYDVLGKEVATLVNDKRDAGSYSIEFNAANLPSGMYIYRIRSGNFAETRRMMLLK
ncbi:MAG: T9SS type A sorting domain-containing protein [Ignavibacteria bacterium]|nr:T9SS type A sorting domain-containing protein [Ignavibacteria bacterium]